MFARVRLCLAACCLLGLLPGPPSSAAARDVGPVAQTPEWQRLTNLWQVMIDHSAGLVFNHKLFGDLIKHLDQADADLAALAERNLLPEALADDLRRLCHARFEYIKEHHYTHRSRIEVSAAESARSAANWKVELHLSFLREAYQNPDGNRNLIASGESNVAYELTFLHHLDKFEAEVERQRAKLKAKEDEGETVDWQSFDHKCQRRRNLLLEANRGQRIPPVRSVQALLPYIFALTRSQAAPSAPASDVDLSDL